MILNAVRTCRVSNSSTTSPASRRWHPRLLPEHVKARDAHVQPHRLEPYDQLKEQADE
jgi:hypothetical protein